MPQKTFDDASTLVQVMAWCLQATSHYQGQGWLSSISPKAASHYLSQCWSRSVSHYGITRPQWVNRSCMEIQLLWSLLLAPEVRFSDIPSPGHIPWDTMGRLTHWFLGKWDRSTHWSLGIQGRLNNSCCTWHVEMHSVGWFHENSMH